MGDVRVALRTLSREKGFALAVVVTLGLSMGLSTGFFGVVNTLLLRPLPGVAADGLVNLYAASDGAIEGFSGFSHPAWRDLRERTRTLSALEAFVGRGFAVSDSDRPEIVGGQLVSGGFFQLLGTRPARGRLLTLADDARGAPPVAVVSHALWLRRFAGRDDVIGSTLRLSGQPVPIVGVAEAGFNGHFVGFPMDVFVPLAAAPLLARDVDLEGSLGEDLELVGRLRPGVARAAATEELDRIGREVERERVPRRRGRGIELRAYTGLDADLRLGVLGFAALLLVVAALVVAVACANVAGLVLARGATRARELAVRASLGATRLALLRPLLAETLLLFAAGGLAGAALSGPSARALEAFLPDFPIPLRLDASPDWRVWLFAFATTLLAGLAFGVAPAASAARLDLVRALRQGGRAIAPGRQRARRVFVAAQVAVSLVLLAGASLFLNELRRARAFDPGFRVEDVAVVTADLRLRHPERASDLAFFEDWLARVRSRPDVEAASLARHLPLGLAPATARVAVDGLRSPDSGGFRAQYNVVSPGYFETLGIPLVAGRDFEARDAAPAEPVALVSRATAARLYPDGQALGRALRHEGRALRVVGVVGDVVADRRSGRGGLSFYVPLAQQPAPRVSLVLRPRAGATPSAVRREAIALEPDAPVLGASSLAEHARAALFPQRLAATVTSAFGLFGLLLASVGLHGIVAFFAVQRRSELAVRAALGARASDLRRLVLREGVRPVATGAAAGLVASVAFARLAQRLVPGMGGLDAAPIAAAALLLLAVALLAADRPARLAAARSPVDVLRGD
jgi:predicted permease